MSDYIAEDCGYETPCWIWQGHIRSDGYGQVRHNGPVTGAHRAAYQLHTGEALPAHIDVHHKCEVRSCVNPAHLEALHEVDHLRQHGRITAADAREIRRRHVPRVVTRKMLAAKYGVSESCIKKVLSGVNWTERSA